MKMNISSFPNPMVSFGNSRSQGSRITLFTHLKNQFALQSQREKDQGDSSSSCSSPEF